MILGLILSVVGFGALIGAGQAIGSVTFKAIWGLPTAVYDGIEKALKGEWPFS